MPDSVFFIYLFLLRKKNEVWLVLHETKVAVEGYGLIVKKKTQQIAPEDN